MFRVVTSIALRGPGHKIPNPKSTLRQAKYFHTTPAPQPQPRHHKPGQNSAKPDTNAVNAMIIKQRCGWGALDGALFIVGLVGGYHLTTFCIEKIIKKGQPRNNRKSMGYACMGEAVKEEKSHKPKAGSCGRDTDSSGPCTSGCQGESCVGLAYPHGINRWI
ncbi:hypothetical protein CKAH01_00482 [Colletotrichum kahawae]|uniref:Uncharacterized protein n=1 Tax=Colletotrichum kahawae TaxID=34407 RepID=A0AAE0DD58_COLKA|nr:hypothetical protein CKAH01_00482 [Colletotrichum kahawae]